VLNNTATTFDDKISTLDYLAWDVYMYTIPDSAIFFGKQIVELGKQQQLPFVVTNGLSIQAVAMKTLGNYPKAIELNEMSFRIYDEMTQSKDSLTHLKGLSGKAASRGNMGNLYRNMGDHEQALKCYAETMTYTYEVMKIMGDKSGKRQKMSLANSYINMGAAYIYQHKWKQAEEANKKALEVFIELQDEDAQASAYRNLGMIAESNLDYQTALAHYEKCLKLRENKKDKTNMASIYNSLAVLYFKLDKVEASIEWNLKSLQIARELKAPVATRDACEGLYHAYRKTENWKEAETYLREALAINERLLEINFPILSEKEREYLFEMVLAEYAAFYSFSLSRNGQQAGLNEKTYALVVRNKGMLLRSTSAMQKRIIASDNEELKKWYKEWMDIRNRIADLYSNNENTEALEAEANTLEKKMIGSSSEFGKFWSINENSWSEVQQHLKSNEAAVEFIAYRDRYIDNDFDQYAAIVIRKGMTQPQLVQLCGGKQLLELIKTAGTNSTSAVPLMYGTKNKSNTALYALIWEAIDPHLKGISTVYYSPDGWLHKLSFAAIQNKEGNYLSDVYQLNCLNNTQSLLQNPTPFSGKANAHVYGGIDYGKAKGQEIWNYLPGTEQEAVAIAKMLEKQKFSVKHFSGLQATEEDFKTNSTSANILHLATHGFFFPDPQARYRDEQNSRSIEKEIAFRGNSSEGRTRFLINPNPLMRSGLVLANANQVWGIDTLSDKEDGVLTALEISTLDLHAVRLLVLSACETGLGDIKGSEGVYGLQRAFKLAGVQSMIISLWQVPDKETSEFMILFYKSLLKSKNISKAFQSAQKMMRAKYDPYYWAAFVLVE
jgi:CHAT domain-containing protein/tetratricopeptide (TPR) repeat protein